MKNTLTSKFSDTVKTLVPSDIDISPASYKYGLKTIHTQEVYNTIAKQFPNQSARFLTAWQQLPWLPAPSGTTLLTWPPISDSRLAKKMIQYRKGYNNNNRR